MSPLFGDLLASRRRQWIRQTCKDLGRGGNRALSCQRQQETRFLLRGPCLLRHLPAASPVCRVTCLPGHLGMFCGGPASAWMCVLCGSVKPSTAGADCRGRGQYWRSLADAQVCAVPGGRPWTFLAGHSPDAECSCSDAATRCVSSGLAGAPGGAESAT